MDMLRVQALWTGFMGAPGYTSFYFAGGGGLVSDAQQVADRVAAAFEELTHYLPPAVDININPTVEVIDSDTGILQSYQDKDPPETISNSDSTGPYAGPAGAVVNWLTNDVRFGRRIRGRTFLVPLQVDAFAGDGTLKDAAHSRVQDFADVLTNWDFDSEFGVWSRPRNGEGGVFASVTGYRVPDMAAVLRSRRD